MFQNLKKIFLGLLGLFFTKIALALPADNEQTLHIVADSSSMNYKSGVNVHEGNVKADQGTTHLTADKIVTKNNAQHKIEEGIAYGLTRLAEYTTIPKPGDLLFRAKAKVMRFYPLKSIIILEGDVEVTQGENSFNGSVIIYNTKDQIITAPPSKGGRATIVIEPNKLKS